MESLLRNLVEPGKGNGHDVGEEVHEDSNPEHPCKVTRVLNLSAYGIVATGEKSTFAIMFADDFPTNPPIFPMPSSRARVDAKPLFGGNHEEKILYCATLVAISPRARMTLPPTINLKDRT